MAATLETVTKAYIDRRDRLDAMEKEHKERTTSIKEEMGTLEMALMKLLDDQGTKSAKTDWGTPYKQEWTAAKVKDREAFLQYVRDNDRFDLLTNAVNKTLVLEQEDAVPGVEVTRGFKVNVRRPSA